MSHTNSTTHYSLPQFVTSDKPAWLTDINNAYTAIDTGIYNAQTDATTAKNTADNAQADATAAGTAASTADNKAAGAIASIANLFDTTATYAVGDLVMYNSLLYKCTVAVSTPGAWTGTTNWTRTTVESEIPSDASMIPLTSSPSSPTTAAAIAEIGAINTTNTSETVASASWKTMATITLPKGKYIVNGILDFGTNSVGARIVMVDTEETNTNTYSNSTVVSGRATIQKINIYALNATTTIYLRAYQDSGSSMTVLGQLRAIRIDALS